MSLNLSNKKTIIAEITAKAATAQTIVVAEYKGIQVMDLTKLRAIARDQGVYLRVIKNTLARRAFKDTIFVDIVSKLTGQLIYAISENEISAAKILVNFSKVNNNLVVKVGNYAGTCLDETAITVLANIPSREILLSRLLRIIQIPVINFVRSLAILETSRKT